MNVATDQQDAAPRGKVNGHSTVAAPDSKLEFSSGEGKRIVLTAPLTEIIDHAGYFIQMAMASLPLWLEWILNRKYPK